MIQELKPRVIVANGDIWMVVLFQDLALWLQHSSNLKDELEWLQKCLEEIEDIAQRVVSYQAIGNHDLRFDKRLATVAPQ